MILQAESGHYVQESNISRLADINTLVVAEGIITKISDDNISP